MVRRLLLAAVLLGWTALTVRAEGDLGIGSAAPKLEVKEFVKGDAVKDLEKGKIYVVEFWATWCGPCRQTIPHVSQLQKKYKDVTFIGVSVWEQDQKGVKPFVEEMGDKMAYRVALDAVPEGGKGGEGAMAKTWMEAAGQSGIPAAFIINGEGKVAWIGHPAQMDKPLAQIVEGKYDLKEASAKIKKEREQRKKVQALQQKLGETKGDPRKILEVVDKAIADDASLEEVIGNAKFGILAIQLKETDKAVEFGKKLINEVYKNDASKLNDIAWTIVAPENGEKADPKLVKIALQAAQKADELVKGKEAAVADTLGKAYFDSGEIDKAIETQERAVKLAKADGDEKGIAELTKRLEEFKKAKK